jgi:ATP-binding cassette subfamily C (CFTR/MRP) protein 1
VFEHVLSCRGIIGAKTRILVTHGIHHLPNVDFVVVMKAGSIIERGKIDALGSSGHELSSIAQEIADTLRSRMSDEICAEAPVDCAEHENHVESSLGSVAQSGALICEEEQATGSVGWKAYWQYILAFGIPGMIFCCFLLVLMSSIQASASWWLGYWSSQPDDEQQLDLVFFLGVYVSLIMACGVVSALADFMFRAAYGLK